MSNNMVQCVVIIGPAGRVPRQGYSNAIPSTGGNDQDVGNKWARLDSNQRPSDYESPALTAEPRARRCEL
jgi:hypothetical protein